MDTFKIRQFHPSITRCELRLQYSSRKTGNYWLEAQLYLYAGDERRRIIFMGGGAKYESEEAIRLLTAQGFTQTISSLNQEWQHISFVREQEHAEESAEDVWGL